MSGPLVKSVVEFETAVSPEYANHMAKTMTDTRIVPDTLILELHRKLVTVYFIG